MAGRSQEAPALLGGISVPPASTCTLPWHDQADRCAVLIGQGFTVNSHSHQRKRVHSFVEAQSLDVGPVERLKEAALPWHFFRTDDGFKSDIFGAA